ncbi:glycosyltransferase [Chitinophaga sp. YIM B06452]|uniref:glycosyltransferase n=1 Tax=Chitinophaga sp. YIM B06452 TaxID=3082158 RepID=UPI0031FF1AC6
MNTTEVPAFSVLIPVYIKENPDFFNESLKSVVNQTLMPAEILIIADGPLTIELDQVIEDYKANYPGLFNVVRLPQNMGMGIAMTTAVKACKYDYIARMDSDDIALPGRFARQMEYLAENPGTDIVGSWMEEFDKVPGDTKRIRKLPENHGDILTFAKQRCPFNHMTVVYKKEKVLQAGAYWEKKAYEDYHLWYQMIKSGCRMHNIPDILVHARIGNNMLSRRRGMMYLKAEQFFFRILKRDGFITSLQYYKVMATRFILRLVPQSLLGLVYKYYLRK